MRLAFVLAIGCLAVAHGSTELDQPYDLGAPPCELLSSADIDVLSFQGDSRDYGGGVQEKEIELQVADEDPSSMDYNINAEEQVQAHDTSEFGGASQLVQCRVTHVPTHRSTLETLSEDMVAGGSRRNCCICICQ